MKIIIENHIPFIKGIFEPFANVVYLPADEITREAMKDADALITRTRTRCDSTLLEGSKCRVIATATIGTDHIDTSWCNEQGIKVFNAPGCNAPAVAQYVMTSIIAATGRTDLSGLTIGIIGVGHVGSIVARWAAGLGMNVMLNDPPRQAAEPDINFSTLEDIAGKADIITFHTPSVKTGIYPTFHLGNIEFFKSLKKKPIIINCARGPITDTDALVEAFDSRLISSLIIDCWENEPAISHPLLERTFIATPHIAGYSQAGKVRATVAAVNAVAGALGLPAKFNGEIPADAQLTVTAQRLIETYNPLADTSALKAAPENFEHLRNHYELRQEP